jgi:hypothetical protein
MLESKEFKLNAILATPFTVLVKLPPDKPNVLELIILTPPEATPFTVDVRVFVLEFSALELIKFTPAPATPFTTVESVLAELLLLTEFTIGEVALTPLTTLVRVFVTEPKVWVVLPLTSGVHTGVIELPVFTMNKLVELLNISKPVAGKMIAFCWAVVIRGARNPLLVLLTSSIALVSAKFPVEFIDTFCA